MLWGGLPCASCRFLVDDSIEFEFPPTEWRFDAVMGPSDGRSGVSTQVRPVEPGVWEIELAGRAGTSIVQLGGSGPDGDYEFVFEAELLVDGVEPPPFVDFAGPYGNQHPNSSLVRLTLSIDQLADDREPSAKVTITDSTGNRIDVVLGDHQDGPDPEGNGAIVLQSPEPDPEVIAGYGPPPYVYDIELTIGDITHHAQVTFAVGLDGATTLSQPSFDPPLPAR